MLCIFAPPDHAHARAFRDALTAHREDTGIAEDILPLRDGLPDDPHTPAVALCFDHLPPDDWRAPHRHVIPVITTVDDGGRLPDRLREYNAFIIDRHGARWAVDLFDEATSLIWLPHRPKRVFLSYVRRESGPIANQLHDALVRDGYRVFLDQWAVGTGAAFQPAIHRDIADTDAVILLATRSFAGRRYVVEEINSALSRRVGVLAVRWPEEPTDEAARQRRDAILNEMIPAENRITLAPADFRRGRSEASRLLRTRTLQTIREAIRRRRLVEIRRRIEDLLPIATHLFGAARSPGNRLGEFVFGDNRDHLVALCPYRPTHLDLHRLHRRARELAPVPHEVTCLHAEPYRSPDNTSVPEDADITALTWLIEDRRPSAPHHYRIRSHDLITRSHGDNTP